MLHKSNRVRAFTGPNAEQRAERVGNWFKAITGNVESRTWCVNNGVGLTKATSESINSVGGFLAPQDFDNAIINVRETVGAFRQGADVRPTRSDGQIRPRRTGGLTANFVTEGASIPESSFTLDAIESAQKKLAILGRASSELFEDSAADLGEFLTSEIGYAFAAKEDDCGFNGDGTSSFSGISGLATKLVGLKSSVAAASTHKTFLTLDSTDLANLMAGVLATAIPGSSWYISATGYAQTICRLAAVVGGLAATQKPDGTISANFLGFPVAVQRQALGRFDRPLDQTDALLRRSLEVERAGRAAATDDNRHQPRPRARHRSSPGPGRSAMRLNKSFSRRREHARAGRNARRHSMMKGSKI